MLIVRELIVNGADDINNILDQEILFAVYTHLNKHPEELSLEEFHFFRREVVYWRDDVIGSFKFSFIDRPLFELTVALPVLSRNVVGLHLTIHRYYNNPMVVTCH